MVFHPDVETRMSHFAYLGMARCDPIDEGSHDVVTSRTADMIQL
jgi:hypothetical protein